MRHSRVVAASSTAPRALKMMLGVQMASHTGTRTRSAGPSSEVSTT